MQVMTGQHGLGRIIAVIGDRWTNPLLDRPNPTHVEEVTGGIDCLVAHHRLAARHLESRHCTAPIRMVSFCVVEGVKMNRTAREHRLAKQREYSEDCRERRLAAGRPKRSDVASALLSAFLDAAIRHGAAPSETLVDALVDAGFVAQQARSVVADLIQRRREQS